MSKLFSDLKQKTAGIVANLDSASSPEPDRNIPAPFLIESSAKRLRTAESQVKELNEQLESLLAGGPKVLNIKLTELHEVAGRKRNLDPENYEILKNNLATNDLVTPIIVRVRKTGGYEIVSGHNRSQAYRELGRTTIPAIVADIPEKDVSKDAFFANLIHSSLPDYEKYLGFAAMVAENPGLTQESLAKTSGVSVAHLSKLMAYSRLPQMAHDILSACPSALGARTAHELALEAEAGRSDLVVSAVQLIANKEIDQGKAKDWIRKSSADSKREQKPKTKPLVVKRGKAAYCSLRQTDKSIRLEFASKEDADALLSKIHALLLTQSKSSE